MKKKNIIFGKKLNFSFDVSTLSNYKNEEVLPLVSRAVFDSDIASLPGVSTKLGIKYKTVINAIDDEIIFQDGSACGNDPSGDTIFSQKEVQVGQIEIFKDWCPKDLTQKWAQVLLPNGSHYEDLPAREAITEFLMSLVNEAVSVALWQSRTNHTQANLKRFNGFISTIDADSPITGNTGGEVSITESNAINIFKKMVLALPARLKKKRDLAFFAGWDTFEALLAAYSNLNNYHIDMSDAGPYTTGVFTLPLWGIKVYAMHGLTGTDRIFLTRESNLWIVSDMAGEEETWRIFYHEKDNKIYGRVEFKLGTTVTFGNEVVQYTNA